MKHSWVKFLIWRPSCLLKLRDLAPDTIKAVVVAVPVRTVSLCLLETASILYVPSLYMGFGYVLENLLLVNDI